ncbi:MAG: glycerol-3-phosphate acyltransferase, partial [Amylibacter sp.]|nr:glycerol-3-phosphate acyltransferase [Amylibacter sp.]
MPNLDITLTAAIAVASLAYLMGSIPFGLVIAKVMGLGDLRKIGSGNIGATNVLRTGNKLAALLTVVFDGGKGLVAVLLAGCFFGETAAQIAGLCAFLGH